MTKTAEVQSDQKLDQSTELGQFIPLHYHYQMLLDDSRVLGFARAIENAVPIGGKVLELGGGTGILSFFASKRAEKVWCVEMNPDLASASKKFLASNNATNVEVVLADASNYLPPEPVDVVICEMLHSALLREKQTLVLSQFQKAYSAKFGTLPNFIPSTTIMAVQPVHQSFNFNGYVAPLPLFFPAGLESTNTSGMADPYSYSTFHYNKPLPLHFACSCDFSVSQDGEINALRFVTKNILAYLLEEVTSVDWYNLYLIMPLSEPIQVQKGQKVKVSFSYSSGGSIEALAQSISVKNA